MDDIREKMIERGAVAITLSSMMAPEKLAAAVIDTIGAAKMAEALAPFAVQAAMWEKQERFEAAGITAGDLDNARAALAKATG